LSAIERAKRGERTISIDEMTGIQALERKFPTQPMRPGKPERQEFEYIRHGTQTLIASFDVASGQVTIRFG
jgi:putative transposase